MRPLRGPEIRGTWATLLLPIAADESIDFARMADEIDYLVATDVDGIYSNGTAGEFYAQSEAEFDRVQSLFAERCENAGKPFQIGASHTSAQTSLSRLRRAAAWKPSAIQIILPDWVPVSGAEAVAFLERMAEAAEPVSLVLYNPPHAKRAVGPEEYGRMVRAAPSLAGVKVAGKDAAWFRGMREHAPELSIFVPGHLLATGMRDGASGSYSNVACLHPAGAKRWNRLMESDPDAALDIERRLCGFMSQHIVPFREIRGYSNQALDKLLAAIGGWCGIGTRLRWPYRGIDAAEARRLRPLADNLIPEVLCN